MAANEATVTPITPQVSRSPVERDRSPIPAPPAPPGNRRRVVNPEGGKPPFVPWAAFDKWWRWGQGEHVCLVGPTKSGKTSLARRILGRRDYVVVMATKPRDQNLDTLVDGESWRLMRSWEAGDPERDPKRVLWPDAKTLYAANGQTEEFRFAMESIFGEGGWCVYIDETWYMTQQLGLRRELQTYMTQGRSNDLTMVCGTQRPSWVPLETMMESEHLFLWRTWDERDVKTLAGLSSTHRDVIKQIVPRLRRHEVLYTNTVTGAQLRTIAPPPPRGRVK